MKMRQFLHTQSALALAVAAATVALPTQASDIKLSGFLSVGGGMVDDGKGVSYDGYSEDKLKFDHNLLGLQITGTVAEKITATAQFTARSETDYQLKAQWAYLTYQATDDTKIRMGRLRTPFYLYSDFLDVGYAYNWISPPREVYYLPFNNIDGVDVYSTYSLGSFDASVQAYFGTFDDQYDFSGTLAPAYTRNQMGIAATIGKDWWNFRVAYHKADLTMDASKTPINATTTFGSFAQLLTKFGFETNSKNFLIEQDDADFKEIGFTADTGTFVSAIEHVEFNPGKNFLAKNIREYAMFGMRHGEWLFNITAQKAKDEVATPEAGIPAGVALPVVGSTNLLIGTLQAVAKTQPVNRDVLSVGARWDFTAGTALKLQLDDVDDDSAGKQKVLSFAVQTVF